MVEPFAKHEWRRANPAGDDVVVIESTDPNDGEKRVFFWMVNAVILGSLERMQDRHAFWRWVESWRMWLRLQVVSRKMDNFPLAVSFGGRVC